MSDQQFVGLIKMLLSVWQKMDGRGVQSAGDQKYSKLLSHTIVRMVNSREFSYLTHPLDIQLIARLKTAWASHAPSNGLLK